MLYGSRPPVKYESLFFRFFHLYLEKYVVLILSEKRIIKNSPSHIDHPSHFMSHWIFSEFSLNVKLYHQFSQNKIFLTEKGTL